MRAVKIARLGHRAAWTDVRMTQTNKPLQSTNEDLLRILSSEKAMRIALAEPAPPIVAMAISSITRCANASDLPLWQITHSGQSERISTGSPSSVDRGLVGREGGQERTPHGGRPWPAKYTNMKLKSVYLRHGVHGGDGLWPS